MVLFFFFLIFYLALHSGGDEIKNSQFRLFRLPRFPLYNPVMQFCHSTLKWSVPSEQNHTLLTSSQQNVRLKMCGSKAAKLSILVNLGVGFSNLA